MFTNEEVFELISGEAFTKLELCSVYCPYYKYVIDILISIICSDLYDKVMIL